MTDNELVKAYDICGKKNRQGLPCARPAGWGTPHPGSGPCKLHGGSTPIKHGLYSKHLKQQPDIFERIQQLKADPKLLDSREYLALLIACSERLVKAMSAAGEIDETNMMTVAKVVDTATKAIERYHKISVGYYISVEKLQTIVVPQILGVIKRHVKDPSALRAIANDLARLKMPE